MFNKRNYKKITVAALAFSIAMGSVSLAAGEIFDKKLTATHGRIKFEFEGKDVTKQIEEKYESPAFTVKEYNSRAYVPVRAISDLMGLEIYYDTPTHTAKIFDPKSEAHKKELAAKDQEIEKLKKEIKKLKDEEKKEEKKEEEAKKDLKAIEKDLNKEFKYFSNVDFDISLSDSGNRIKADIAVDLKDSMNRNYWYRMSYGDKKYMMETVVSKIEKEFPNKEISGVIHDSSSSKRELYIFNMDKWGKVRITSKDYDTGGTSTSDYYIERAVEDEFRRAGIYDAKLDSINIGSKSSYLRISFTDKYSNEWDRLSIGEIEAMLDYISREVEYESYDGLDLDISVYENNRLLGDYYKPYYTDRGTFKRR